MSSQKRKPWSDERRAKTIASLAGRHLSESHKAKISASEKGSHHGFKFQKGAPNPAPGTGKYGSEALHYKGGHINRQGYRVVYDKGRRVMEHRLVMGQKLGRKLLPSEHVHHINHDKLDNRPENLMLLTNGEHQHLHSDAVANARSAKKHYH